MPGSIVTISPVIDLPPGNIGGIISVLPPYSVDYTRLDPSPVVDPTQTLIAIYDAVTKTYKGASISSVISLALGLGSIRKPPSSATVIISSTDIEVGIDTRTTAVAINLPGANAWSIAHPFGQELVIIDYYGNAFTNKITPLLAAGDVFAGAYASAPPVISANSGLLRLRPDPSLPGWIVRGVN